MKKYLIYILACLTFSLPACKELYDPQVDQAEPMIVVEGLLTNEFRKHSVSISYAVGYNDPQGPAPLSDAEVFIRDQDGNHYIFMENYWAKGTYTAYYPLKAEKGKTYTLTIRTADGLHLESTPQQVYGMTGIDAVFGDFDELEMLETNHYGDHYIVSFEGLEVFINIGQATDGLPRMRYEARILQLYHTANQEGEVTYFWKKIGDPGPPNVNFLGLAGGQGDLKNHYLTFVPLSRRYYGFTEEQHMNGRYLLIKKFRLNEDAHRFYKEAARQLASDNNVFDPIAAQISGNMFCVSHPDKKVLGLFEVSSYEGETYSVKAFKETGLIEIGPYEDLNHLDPRGSIFLEQPSFWRWN